MNRRKLLLSLLLAACLLLCAVTAQAATVSERVEAKVNELVSTLVNENSSAYKRAKVMHDWLIYNANYDTTYTYYYPEGVLLEGAGVCQSYALAYQKLLNAAGMECVFVMSDDMDHGWNMVKLGEEWFHVDCTWDDPVGGGWERDTYFLVSDDDMLSLEHYNWYAYDRYGSDRYPDTPTADSDTYDKSIPFAGEVTAHFASLAEVEAELKRLEAAGETDEIILAVDYDGTETGYQAVKNWAWYTERSDNFRIRSLLKEDTFVELGIFWHTDYGTLEFDNISEFIDVGDTVTVDVVYKDTSGFPGDVTGLVWSSDNEKIATVDQNGVVTGVSPGLAIVTVSLKDAPVEDTIRINVMPPMQADFDLTFTRTGGTSATLTWKSVPGVTEYRVYGMANGHNTYTLMATTSKQNASLTLSADKQYRFYVQGVRVADGQIIASHKSPSVGDLPEAKESDYAAVYDYDTYLAKNADVANAYGGNREAALRHFLNSGMKEGRVANNAFNVYYYRANYADLAAAFGDDLVKYYMHFINSGKAEGRTADKLIGAEADPNAPDSRESYYAPVYDFDYYVGTHPDIAAAFNSNRTAMLDHFINYGMAEGRQGSSSFNVYYYCANYADLQGVCGSDLKAYYMHFINYGMAEGRTADKLIGAEADPNAPDSRESYYAPVYDFDYYVGAHPDIAAAFNSNRTAMLDHFINYGMAEGRQGSSSFNVYYYCANYADLQGVCGSDLKAYYMHFINYGMAEGRTADKLIGDQSQQPEADPNAPDSRESYYAPVYDFDYYVSTHPDIAAAFNSNRTAMLDHFINYGMAEGRQGSSSFNVHYYRANYAALQDVFGSDLKAYYMHFVNYGKAEGRTADKLIGDQSQQPEADPNAPDSRESYYAPVYDFDYYTGKYPDIAAMFNGNRTAILDHFINYGMAEGRQGSSSFNVYSYRANYADLQDAFGSDLKAYYMHFISNGKAEGRSGK